LVAPASVLPYIIGKKGANLRIIQDNSGANVQIPKRTDSETTSVADDNTLSEHEDLVEITIEGTDAAVVKARDEISKIIDERVELAHSRFSQRSPLRLNQRLIYLGE